MKYSRKNKESVYQPSDDSFLLLDAVCDNLAKNTFTKKLQILEACCGTGVIIRAVYDLLGADHHYIALDKHSLAAETTTDTFKLDPGCENYTVLVSDNLDEIENNSIDIIICNPVSIFNLIYL